MHIQEPSTHDNWLIDEGLGRCPSNYMPPSPTTPVAPRDHGGVPMRVLPWLGRVGVRLERGLLQGRERPDKVRRKRVLYRRHSLQRLSQVRNNQWAKIIDLLPVC